MLSENQQGNDSIDTEHKEEETVIRWDEEKLRNIIPMNEASARRYLGATHKHDCSTETKEHFASQVRKHK